MARPEPNIFSQKWGKGWEGAAASISIVWAADATCGRSVAAERAAATRSNATRRTFLRTGRRHIASLPKKRGGVLGAKNLPPLTPLQSSTRSGNELPA